MNKRERGQIFLDRILEENQLPLIDSHFHAKNIAENESLTAVLEKMEKSHFFGGMDIGTTADDLPERTALLINQKNILMSAGIGPWGIQEKDDNTTQVDRLIQEIDTHLALSSPDANNNLINNKIAAIGEIGLDNHWDYGPIEKQQELFHLQLDLAKERKLPIVIHTREADREMIHILQSRSFDYSGIIHCFSSSWELAKVALDKGFYISFAGPITYNKNEELRENLAKVPEDRLLLETDSSYLTPEPFRGRSNTPLNMPFIYAKASEVRKVALSTLITKVAHNFSTLLGDS